MINFFRKILSQKSNPQVIAVTIYPDTIEFKTMNQIKNSYWSNSDEMEYLNLNASNEEIGKIISKQLSLSKYGIKIEDKLPHQSTVKQKRKSVKESMKDSKLVSIRRHNNEITFVPTFNGGSTGKNRGYMHLENTIEINSDSNFECLGKTFREAELRCQ